MALVTHPNVELPLHSGSLATVRIEPQRNLFELRLYEVWQYRELMYFFVWRDANWEITELRGKSRHVLDSFNPVMIRFVLDAHESIQRGVHGVTLYNAERQIFWGRAAYELEITQGVHEFTYESPMLPLKPGGYTWGVSLWDDDGLIDMGDLVPDMIVSTESHQHPLDEWSGVLNMPCAFSVRAHPILQNSCEL